MLTLTEMEGEKGVQSRESVPDVPGEAVLPEVSQARLKKVTAFYAQQKHTRVSKEKIEKEAKILERLEQEGFTTAEIDVAMSWLLHNRGKFGGEIHSLKLLPETIGQALTDNAKVCLAKERAQRQSSQREEIGTDQLTSPEQEAKLCDLSVAEKADLQELAVASLIRAGYKAEVVRELKSLVKNEMHRILDEKVAMHV
jgi:hypothetical protein